MTPQSDRPVHPFSGTLKILGVGVCVFLLGIGLAVWLTVHNVHGFLEFLDDALAGIAAGLLVLLYERPRQRAIDKLRESERVLEERTALLQTGEELLRIFVKH